MDAPTRLPTLFLSHGSPMLAVEDSPAGRFLDGLGRATAVAEGHRGRLGALHDRPADARRHMRSRTRCTTSAAFPSRSTRSATRRPARPTWPKHIAQRLADAGLDAARAREPRSRPRRVGAAAAHVSRGRHSGGAAVGDAARHRGAALRARPGAGAAARRRRAGDRLRRLRAQPGRSRLAASAMRRWRRGHSEFGDWMHTMLSAHDWPACWTGSSARRMRDTRIRRSNT